MNELAAAPQQLNAVAAILWAWAVDFVPRIASAVVVFALGYVAAKWIGRLVSRLLGRSGRLDATYIPSIRAVISYSILIFVTVAALAQLGVQTTSILAALGAAGLAIGLALQGTLANIAAGIILLWLRPFRAGEYIGVDTAEGTVREIGLFATLLDAPDGSFRFVPNSQLWNKPLANYTRNPLRRVDIRVVIPRGRDVEKARRLILEIAEADQRVLAKPAAVEAVVTEIGETNSVVMLRAWTASANYFQALKDMFTEIQRRLDATDLTLSKPATGEPPKPTIG
jgi:small conductance mechanosensitive channel